MDSTGLTLVETLLVNGVLCIHVPDYLPFIIVSQSIGEDLAVPAMKAGASDYLLKRSLGRLVPVVAREVADAERRRARRAAEWAVREREQQAVLELAAAYEATWEGWARALDLRDRETEGHSRRVTDLTLRLARIMGLNEADCVHIRRGALLHDIGKMGVPDRILLKTSALSPEEWTIMQRHPAYAQDLLAAIEYLKPRWTSRTVITKSGMVVVARPRSTCGHDHKSARDGHSTGRPSPSTCGSPVA